MSGWGYEELDQLKDDVIALCKERDLWHDSCIYVNGNRYRSDEDAPGQVVVEEGLDPKDYFEYVRKEGNIFAMSFEGPLYMVLNYYVGGYDDFLESFEALFAAHGLYYELGHAWNFSCYPEPGSARDGS